MNLPTFVCVSGCTACCGPVPFSRKEWERVMLAGAATGKIMEVVPFDDEGTVIPLTATKDCAFIEKGRCGIYELRPMICRVFGMTPMLHCPKGRKPSFWLKDRDVKRSLGIG